MTGVKNNSNKSMYLSFSFYPYPSSAAALAHRTPLPLSFILSHSTVSSITGNDYMIIEMIAEILPFSFFFLNKMALLRVFNTQWESLFLSLPENSNINMCFLNFSYTKPSPCQIKTWRFS